MIVLKIMNINMNLEIIVIKNVLQVFLKNQIEEDINAKQYVIKNIHLK